MKTITFKLDTHALTIVLGISVAVILLFIAGNQYMNYRETQKVARNMQIMDMCETDAYNFYSDGWANECKGRGEGADCLLPNASAVLMDTRKVQKKADCLKAYGL